MSETQEKYLDLFAALAAPFDASEVKSRSQSGKTLHYITARTVMNRLDDVVGPSNWWDRYTPNEKSVLCEITIRLPDGSTLTKSDAGGFAGMADSGDDEKSGFSDAFKRACVKLGIGRYLYRDGVPHFAQERNTGPAEPAHERSNGAQERPRQQQADAPRPGGRGSSSWGGRQPDGEAPVPQPANGQGGNGSPYGNTPKSGKALFAWCKDMEAKYAVGLIKYLNGFAKLQEWPARMTDFDADQVKLAHAEAIRKLQKLDSDRYEEALSN